MEPKLNKRSKPDTLRLINQKPMLEALGLLVNPFKVILIGGTNGKGSTANLLAQIAIDAGFTVGLNSSPHLIKYNERIQINCKPITDAELQKTFDDIHSQFNSFPLNYAEYSFLAGLYTFKRLNVDIAIFEIGLGGRQDPANTLDADMAIITNIDFDHMAILGNTIEAIAYEKAGIIKPAKPFICGHNPCPKAILSQVKKQNAHYFQVPSHAFLNSNGIVQSNVNCAEKAAEILGISQPIIQNRIQHFKLPGRLQTIAWHCPTICDVAHNPGSVKMLTQYLDAHHCQGKRYAIFAASNTKDIPGILAPIKHYIDQWFFPAVKGLCSPDHIQTILNTGDITHNVSMTLKPLQNLVLPEDQLIIFGSFYLVGEALCLFSNY